MNVEFTGRQVEITSALRARVEQGLNKVTKLLGDNYEAKVILSVERHRHLAEISVLCPNRKPVVGLADAKEMNSAVDGALNHAERQLLKDKGRWQNLKHHKKVPSATGRKSSAKAAKALQPDEWRLPSGPSHVIKLDNAVELRPMTVEEAVKEAEFRDRHVFVFHDKGGNIQVLHRRNDGKVELIEVS
jgi:putative sigma-54 modulation protein